MEKAKELLLSGGLLPLKVTPKARSETVGDWNAAGELTVKVRAPAEDGRANEAVIELLSDVLGLPRSRLEITRGHTGRHKTVVLRK